jgi:hypothetical protein
MTSKPQFDRHIGRDAMRVWNDFWELAGGMRLDIVRKSYADGDPSLMIAPEVETTTIPSVRAVLIDGNVDTISDRSGDIASRSIKLEMIDIVHDTDTLTIGGCEYRIDSVLQREYGSFSVCIVEAHR